jgi:hypothetical protein
VAIIPAAQSAPTTHHPPLRAPLEPLRPEPRPVGQWRSGRAGRRLAVPAQPGPRAQLLRAVAQRPADRMVAHSLGICRLELPGLVWGQALVAEMHPAHPDRAQLLVATHLGIALAQEALLAVMAGQGKVAGSRLGQAAYFLEARLEAQ